MVGSTEGVGVGSVVGADVGILVNVSAVCYDYIDMTIYIFMFEDIYFIYIQT